MIRIPNLRECIVAVTLGLAAGNAIAPHVRAQGYTTYNLPVGNTAGITVGFTGYAPNAVKLPNPKLQGFKGIIIQGQGESQSFINMDNWGASLMIGLDCGDVQVRDCTIVGAKDYGIKYQSERGEFKPAIDPATNQPYVPTVWQYHEYRTVHFETSRLTLLNVRFVLGNGNRPQWFVHTNGVDHYWINVEADASLANVREHMLYAHGVAKYGIYFDSVRGFGIGSEYIKVATRPWEAFYAPGATLHIEDSIFRNFGQPNANFTGGGVLVLQGSGLADVYATRTVFEGRMDGSTPKDLLVGVSDGLSQIQPPENNQRRYYAIETGEESGVAAAGHSANGTIRFEDCAFLGFGGNPAIETLTLYPNYQSIGIAQHFEAQGFEITNCAALDGNGGNDSYIRLREVKNDNVQINGNNTVELVTQTHNLLGWTSYQEMFLDCPPLGALGPISGFIQ